VAIRLREAQEILDDADLGPFISACDLPGRPRLGRSRAAWLCGAGGMVRTRGDGAVVAAFRWPEVTDVWYSCDLCTVPRPAALAGYAWTAVDRFRLVLADAEHSLSLPCGGPPEVVYRAGPPSPVSIAISDGVSAAQLAAAQATMDAGGQVRFGPLTASADGLGTIGGLLPWSQIERVRVDHWAAELFYNPRAEPVHRFLRIFITVSTEAAAGGRDPASRSRWWEVTHVPDITWLRRVRPGPGPQPESVELTATDRQIPNLFTLLRLFDAHGLRDGR
jgi:hypothetical protein